MFASPLLALTLNNPVWASGHKPNRSKSEVLLFRRPSAPRKARGLADAHDAAAPAGGGGGADADGRRRRCHRRLAGVLAPAHGREEREERGGMG